MVLLGRNWKVYKRYIKAQMCARMACGLGGRAVDMIQKEQIYRQNGAYTGAECAPQILLAYARFFMAYVWTPDGFVKCPMANEYLRAQIFNAAQCEAERAQICPDKHEPVEMPEEQAHVYLSPQMTLAPI